MENEVTLTVREQEELQRQSREQGVVENVKTGFQDTALSAGITIAQDEGELLLDETGYQAPEETSDFLGTVMNTVEDASMHAIAGIAAMIGFRAGEADYDKDAERDRLIKDIPISLQDSIMQEDNLGAAERTRERILTEIERGRTIAAQEGVSPTMALMLGSMVDVDIPLTFMSGGGLAAAKVAAKTTALAKKAGVGAKVAERTAGVAVGASSGLQAGLAVGIAETNWKETADWTNVADVALTTTLLGAGFGAALPDFSASIKEARTELYDNVTQGKTDQTVHATGMVPVNRMNLDTGVGAAQAGDQKGVLRATREDPLDLQTDADVELRRMAEDWRHESGWQERKDLAADELWTKVATSGALNLTTSNFNTLYMSNSAIANWFAGNVFESANGLGRGRWTSSMGTDIYNKTIFDPIAMEVTPALTAWAKENNHLMLGKLPAPSTEGKALFNRAVMLERNARYYGRPSTTTDVHILRAADAFDEAANRAVKVGKGREGETAMDGFENLQERAGYSPQLWNGKAMTDLIESGRASRKSIEHGMADAYRAAGMWEGKDALAVAKAVVGRAMHKSEDMDTSMVNLLSKDGREFLRETLQNSSVSKDDIERILTRVTGDVEGRAREGFTKSRNDIDLDGTIESTDGSDIRIVDLLDQDLGGTWNRYARRVAGGAALARVGITSRAQRKQFIKAMQAEQRALGETPIEADLMESMLSHFNGGAVKGYSNGVLEEGIGTELSMLKKVTNLSLLQQLGIPQLAETGATIATTGIQNWAARSLNPILDKAMKDSNGQVLEDLAFMTGRIGQDDKLLTPHLNMDDMAKDDKNALIASMSTGLNSAQALQATVTGFNAVRNWQQRTAALGITDKIFRTLKQSMDEGTELPESFTKRMAFDLGLFEDDIFALKELISDGTIEFKTVGKHTLVDRLNVDKWNVEMSNIFGAAVGRNVSQVVQKTHAGETDAWMHRGWAAVFLQLKSFPLAAIQKSFMRNMRHMDSQTLATLGYGFATAYLALTVKDMMNGKERTTTDQARRAFGYSNMTGWVPMAFDPAMSMLGLDDMRMNPYGRSSDILGVPSLDVVNRLHKVPGAVMTGLSGNEMSAADTSSIKAIPFLNLYGMSRIWD